MKKIWKKWISPSAIPMAYVETGSALLAIVCFYVVIEHLGITCPIKWLTGVSCAGCGMSRAWMALLQFHFAKAFAYHPLVLLPPFVVLIIFFGKNTIR